MTITKTMTITVSEAGDTLKQDIFTDRLRIRDRAQLKVKSEKVKVVRDTVFIERRDSVLVEKFQGSTVQEGKARASPFVSALKWVFWIVVAVTVLVVIIKIGKVFRV